MSSSGQIASIICKNFTQNAWKKDLCSNCFKSEVEHQDSCITNCNSAGDLTAPVINTTTKLSQSSDAQNNQKDMKTCKISTPNGSPLSATNVSCKQSSNIKTLNNINVNQINCIKNISKSVNDCENTTTTILQSSKKSLNFNNISSKVVMNTKKLNTNNILLNSSVISDQNNCCKSSDKVVKDNPKESSNLNNKSSDLRKVNTTKAVISEGNNDFVSNKTVISNQTTKDPKQQDFPQLSQTKDKLILSQTNAKNNSIISSNSNKCLTETTASSPSVLSNSTTKKTGLSVVNKTMPLIGILKTESNRTLIKYRQKNKCIVFKEGDPLIIGYGPVNGYGSEEEYSDEEPEDEESDDFDDDEQLYYSDDKELRELTRINTKFNSNFSNFSINNTNDNKVKQIANQSILVIESNVVLNADNCVDSNTSASNDLPIDCSVVVNKPNVCETEESIPEVCHKLVENTLIETFVEINDTNSGVNCDSMKSLSPDSANSDILPMSTSSDSYSSSSSDEKEDSINFEAQNIDIENFKTHLIITQNGKPLLETKHLRTDSESDNSSNNSDSGLEIKDYKRRQESIKGQLRGTKPQIPVKPIISSTVINLETKTKTFPNSGPELEIKISEDKVDNRSGLFIIADDMYQEVCESSDDMNGIEGKITFSKSFDSDNNLLTNGKPSEIGLKPLIEAKRDIKLAELAHELEQVRHMKRPAPQPPVKETTNEVMVIKQEITEEIKPIIDKQHINCTQVTAEKKMLLNCPPMTSQSVPLTSSTPIKPNRFSIRKLLHKKSSSDKLMSVKARDHSNDSQHSVSGGDGTADRKAWKQSDFKRSNLKIVHPIDLTQTEKKTIVSIEPQEERPEAPPRTPKPSRPSVPARRRKSAQLLQPRGEPPPPPPPTTPPPPLSEIPINPIVVAVKAPTVEINVKTNDLNEAYNLLAKSNYSNLLAIKSKIESMYNDIDYKWSDFDVTNGIRLGSALLYKDSIVSNSRKSINLLVLNDCYCAPIVTRFRHHSDLVLILDRQWTDFYLLSELSVTLEEKLMNSLILQLFSILENLEKNNCNHLPNNTIDRIIICTSKEDCLLVVPIESSNISDHSSSQLTLHQFLAQVLAKLLPNSMFGSVDSQVLSRPSVPISQSKTIVQLMAFQIPVHQMCDSESDVQQINYWFDINRSKFINQFCCLSVGPTKLLTNLDYIYLNFLCNNNIDLIRTSIALLVNTSNSC